ncbi:MAG TPA: alpha/beta hydrolase [Terriglobia bacterium]
MQKRRAFYGKEPLQFGDLRVPDEAKPPVAVVIHGGFWRNRYGLDYIEPICEALTADGIATWNIEYRRIGDPGGGWPGTFEDVVAAEDHLTSLAAEFALDLKRVITIGHSAGGHLALWLAAEKGWIAGAVSLAGVVDLRRAWELKLSKNVVAEFLGGSPDEVPARYSIASPIERLPLGRPQKLFHGTADSSVPFEISERYAQAAQLRGDDAELVRLEGAGHFELVDPKTGEFGRVRDAVKKLVR